MEKIVYSLVGLGCANCGEKIREKSKKLSVVENAVLNFMKSELILTLHDKNTDKKKLYNDIKKIVYDLEPDVVVSEKSEINEEISEEKSPLLKKLPRIIISVLLLILAVILDKVFTPEIGFNFAFISVLIIYLASYFTIGYRVVLKAAKNITKGEIFDENFLMTIATIGAFCIAEFPEAVAVMLFYEVGETFQEMAVGNTRRSVKKLMDIRPDYANIKINGDLVRVSPESIMVGDIIYVKAGERVPLDGYILSGSGSVDTAALTGESLPRDLDEGDEVLSGFVNINGLLEIKVTKMFSESTVQKVLELAENAGQYKSKTEGFITRFAKIYTPIVVLIGVIIAVVIPLVFGLPFSEWIYKGLVFLMVSCPCALVISVPLSYFAGIGKASKNGILVKGGTFLDLLTKLDTVVFDKTGTLTKGNFKIDEIIPSKKTEVSKEEVLEIAAYAEFNSDHPIAAAIKDEFLKHGKIDAKTIISSSEIPGKGTIIKRGNSEILAGNIKLMNEHNIQCEEIMTTHINVAINCEYIGSITLTDELKENSKKTVSMLKREGKINTVMLTGDSKTRAEKIAEELQLDHVYSELLPEGKSDKLKILKENLPDKKTLAYVGDGINDAPVLKMSDIGIAMGGLGSDSAIEAADIVLMNDDPYKLIEAIEISKSTRKIVMQNVTFALGVKLLVQILSLFGLAAMWLAVIADVGVTFLVILNSMRLLKNKQ